MLDEGRGWFYCSLRCIMVLKLMVGRKSFLVVVMAVICAAASGERAAVGAVNEQVVKGLENPSGEEDEIARSEVAVLMDFKRCMKNVSAGSPLADWNNQSTYCKWTGVSCDGRGHVVELGLPATGLEGTVTAMLANLTWLTELDLSFNNLTGPLPQDLPPRLVTLILSGNDFYGSLPESLGQLGELQILELAQNRFSGTIPRGLGNCSRLYWLELWSNQLSGELPTTLANCTELYVFDVSDNNFDGGIPSEYALLNKLVKLDFSTNPLSGSLSPSIFSNWTALVYLALIENRLDGQIPSSLSQLPFLEVLLLSSNLLSGAIPPDLANCSSLARLELNRNFLSSSIPSQLGSISFLPSLRNSQYFSKPVHPSLNLAYNRLSGRIPPSLHNCSGLTFLNLASNNLTDDIPAELGQLHKLTSLFLENNKLTGTIPITLGNLSQLQYLYMNLNDLTGRIPQQLSFLFSLVEIDLRSNQLEGPIPQRVGSMKNLEKLIFSTNSLSGVLPSSLANCTKLLTLQVDSNLFSGFIPSFLSNLTQLQFLDLHYNHFEGSIPGGLDGCGELYELNLAQNALDDRIPSDLGNLRLSLRFLYLQCNQLQGPIPDNLGSATNLEDINLSHNNLTGSIPASVGNLHNLNFNLDLSHNFLSGLIPHGLGASMVFVQMIDLSSNDLWGGIPERLGDCVNLGTLNLSFNSLNGTIPPSLGKLENLVRLDLSVNNLSGQIPSQFSALPKLQLFNVSQNQLQGRIPYTGPFSKLTAAAFSSNPGLCGPPLLVPCSSSSSSRLPALAGIVCGVVFGTALVLLLCFLMTWGYRMSSKTKKFSNREALVTQVPPLRVTPEELHIATDGYSESNLLGVGGSSKVYKGMLRNGKTVAVKRLNIEDSNKAAQNIFEKECETLGKIRHRNLVKILSTCCNLEMKALVLDYMPNGSLEKLLFQVNAFELTWEKMFDIALNVANALVYLHYECDVPVIHCDLKPSNIMLDEDFVAHVGDFGIAKLLSPTVVSSSTSHFRGSIGYIAPECAEFGHHSTKVDVYSYGVVLLCMLTRKQPTSDLFDHGIDLSTWVKMFLPDMFLEAIDPTLRAQIQGTTYETEVLLVLKIGLLCTSPNPSNRPTSKEALKMLLQISTCRSNSNSRPSNLEM